MNSLPIRGGGSGRRTLEWGPGSGYCSKGTDYLSKILSKQTKHTSSETLIYKNIDSN